MFRVTVPGHGVWERDPGKSSMFYTVYENAGRDYHVTINSDFLGDHAAQLGTHISSNAEIAGSRVHWPNPGALSLTRQAWLNAHNTGQFDALITAFSQRLRLCATNIELSRTYDAHVAERRKQRFAEVAKRHQVKANYKDQLTDWVLACPESAYLPAFRYEGGYYYLDYDLRVVVLLHPPPHLIMQGEKLNEGFINNICMPMTSGGLVESLTGEHIDNLTNGVTLLYIASKKFAMLTTDFSACESDGNILSLADLVDLAVATWIREAMSGPGCEVVAFDEAMMNVNGPNRAELCLQIADLLDEEALKRIGVSVADELAPKLQLDELPKGFYPEKSCLQLITQLPPILRVKRGKLISFILAGKLTEGWSNKLKEATVPNLAILAQKRPKYQIWAEDLAVGDQFGLIIYLWPDSGGIPLFVGLEQYCLPGAKVRKGRLDAEQAEQVAGLFTSVLTASEVVVTSTAIVVVRKNGQMFESPICVDKRTMAEFDYDQATQGYLLAMQAQQQREEEAKAVADARYDLTWQNLKAGLEGSVEVTMNLYQRENNGKIVAMPFRGGVQIVPGLKFLGFIRITKRDARYRRQNIRLLEFKCAGDGLVKTWSVNLFTYVTSLTLDLPQGVDKYLLTLR